MHLPRHLMKQRRGKMGYKLSTVPTYLAGLDQNKKKNVFSYLTGTAKGISNNAEPQRQLPAYSVQKTISNPGNGKDLAPSMDERLYRAEQRKTTQTPSGYDWESLLKGYGGGMSGIGRFAPSAAYNNAMAYTNGLLEKLNSGRTSYSDKIDALMNQINGRDKFVYDMDKDPMFQQYLSSMMDKGKIAMQDTIGQASALTGGYGSTYATSAANGAYNDFVKGAYDNVSDYYNMSLNAYNSEGQELYNRLGMYQNADAAEYSRLAAAYDANLQRANTLYNQEYNNYWDTANYNKSVAQYNNSQKEKLAELYTNLLGGTASKSGTSKSGEEAGLKQFLLESNHGDIYNALQNMYKMGGSLDDKNSDYYKLMDSLFQQGYDIVDLDSAVRSGAGTAKLSKDSKIDMFDRYTVQLPDGQVQTMSKKEIDKLIKAGTYIRYLDR